MTDEIKKLLSTPNIGKFMKDKQDEDGMVRIEDEDTVYEIIYVKLIPPSDCMEEYKRRQKEKLVKTFNLILI